MELRGHEWPSVRYKIYLTSPGEVIFIGLTSEIGPIIGGFVYQYLGWRWINWIVLICGGVSFLSLFLCKETYTPVLLRAKRAKRQKETGDERWWCRYDNQTNGWALIRTNLTRPLSMAVLEPIW